MTIMSGVQNAVVRKAYVGATEAKHTLYVQLKLDVGDDSVSSWIYLTSKAMGIARARLKAVGFDVDKHALEEIEGNPDLLNGKECLVDIFEEVYNGKPQQRVEIVIPRPVVGKAALAKATKELREAKKDEKAAAPATPPPTPPPDGDENGKDIPF